MLSSRPSVQGHAVLGRGHQAPGPTTVASISQLSFGLHGPIPRAGPGHAAGASLSLRDDRQPSSSGRGEEPRGRWAHCSTVLAATAQSRRPSSDPSASGTREDASHGAAGGGGPGQDPGRKRRPGEKSADYYANVGDAVRTLREDLPMMFMREPNFNIYRDDIVFRDPRICIEGKQRYRTVFWSLRFHGRIFFRHLYLEVRRIWQPSDGVINMRWTVHGVPRVPWEAEGRFDGISQYKLDSDGLIYEHSVDNIILRDPPMAFSIPLFENILAPKTQPLGSPCPFFLDGPPRDARDLASAPTGPWDSEAQAPAAAVGRHEGSPPLTLSIPELTREAMCVAGTMDFAYNSLPLLWLPMLVVDGSEDRPCEAL